MTQKLANKVGVTATENGSQTDASFESMLLNGIIPALTRIGYACTDSLVLMRSH